MKICSRRPYALLLAAVLASGTALAEPAASTLPIGNLSTASLMGAPAPPSSTISGEPVAAPKPSRLARLWPDDIAQRNRILLTTGAVGVGIFGAAQWWRDGFTTKFKVEREGWFGRDTRNAGLDKTGHAFSNYAGVRMLTPMLVGVGNTPQDARRQAALATAGVFTLVEVLDAFSRSFVFSPEDAVMNVLGAGTGYLFEAYPALADAIDLRLGYRKEPGSPSFDPFGDYEGQRYLVVLKGDGVAPLRDSGWTRYLEFSVGYGVRNLTPPPGSTPAREFERFVGVSINLSRVLADGRYGGRKRTTGWQTAADVGLSLFQHPLGAWHTSTF
jgi:hypothetical protein